jgi:hypothetical protein
MKHLHAYLIEPLDGRYTNNKKVGDSNLILNTQIENHKFVNRKAKIVETPINNPFLQKNDLVIVHHNVFRRYFNVKGQEQDSSSYFKDGLYRCYDDQIFLYKRNGRWFTPPGYCFVKPLEQDNSFLNDKERAHIGVLKHLGDDLRGFNLSGDDLVGFTPNSEYEFVIDSERLYRVPLNSIAIKYEIRGTEKEYNPSWV